MAQSFFVRLQPVAGDVYLATPLDTPPPGGGGGEPPVIWPNPPEGQAPLPSHPIALPGDPWWGADLKPEHPIVIPPPGETPPGGPPGTGGLECRWCYTDAGWVLYCKGGPYDKPRPQSR